MCKSAPVSPFVFSHFVFLFLLCDFWLTLGSIESMKMETVIRSPQDGVVKKLAHKEGVSISVSIIVYDLFANCCCRIFARRGPCSCCSRSLLRRSRRFKSRRLLRIQVTTPCFWQSCVYSLFFLFLGVCTRNRDIHCLLRNPPILIYSLGSWRSHMVGLVLG